MHAHHDGLIAGPGEVRTFFALPQNYRFNLVSVEGPFIHWGSSRTGSHSSANELQSEKGDMQPSQEELKKAMRDKTDEELYLLLQVNTQDFTIEAIEAARDEFRRRQLDELRMSRVAAVDSAQIDKYKKLTLEKRKPALGRWNWVWPDVDTEGGAAMATKGALWAAVMVAVVTSIAALLGAMDLDAWALVDGIAFGAIAVGLWRRSRCAAWGGLLLYIAERAYMWSTIGMKNPVIAGIFVLAFIGGIRGTSALHRMARFKTRVEEQPFQTDAVNGR